jgi:hypothetical protein
VVVFERLFIQSRGQPITYGDKRIQLADTFKIPPTCTLQVVMLSYKKQWRQGVHVSTSGSLVVNDRTVKNAIVLWTDTAPQTISIKVASTDGVCRVKNVWDTGNGTIQSWHNGAAMVVDSASKVRRYECNDGHPNDDFDDLIFTIEILS